MASLVELNGMIGRTQDFSALKQNEDNKPLIDQSHIHVEIEKKEDRDANTVKNTAEAMKQDTHADAREKGKGSYAGDGGRKRPGKLPEEGRVIRKGQSHFDLSV